MSIADHIGWIRFTGRSPSGEDEQEFKLPTKTVLHFRSKGHERKFLEIFLTEPVLKKPKVIFEGLERDEFGHGLCYCGVPPFRQITADVQGPPPEGLVFMIFLNYEFTIFEFRWEKMDDINTGYPRDYETRFGAIKWHH